MKVNFENLQKYFLKDDEIENADIDLSIYEIKKVLVYLLKQQGDKKQISNENKEKKDTTNEEVKQNNRDIQNLKLFMKTEIKDEEVTYGDDMKYSLTTNHSLNISQIERSRTKKNKITYITICSSAASTGKSSIVEASNDSSGMKAALFGVEDDVHKVDKLFKNLGNNIYVNQGSYTFTIESVNTMAKEAFLNNLQTFFDNQFTNGCMIYYSGHGFPDASLLFESSQGNYYINYDDIMNLWKNRANPKANSQLLIVLDCCFSGSWVRRMLEEGDFNDASIQASCTDEEKSLDMGAGKGSLFTNAFLWSNLCGKTFVDGKSPVKVDFEFAKIDSEKFLNQRPRAIGFDDTVNNFFKVTSANFNSWNEIEYQHQAFSKWKNYRWIFNEQEEIYSQMSYQIISKGKINNDKMYDCYEYLVAHIKEHSFSIQGELFMAPEEKIQIRGVIKNKKITKNLAGYLSIYKKVGTSSNSGIYSNFSSKGKLRFTRHENECDDILNKIKELIISIEDRKIKNSTEIENVMREIFVIGTKMDKTCLIQDEDNDEDDDDMEEDDCFDQIENLQIDKLNLKQLSLSSPYNADLHRKLTCYLQNKECSLEMIKIKPHLDIESVEDLLLNKQITGIEIDLNEMSKRELYESLQYLNTKKHVKLTLPNTIKTKTPYKHYSFVEKLQLSDTLLSLEFNGFIDKYEYLLPVFSEIRSLRSFCLRNYRLDHYNMKDFEITPYTEKEIEDSNNSTTEKIFKGFSHIPHLKIFKIINCGLRNVYELNSGLEVVDFSNNLISQYSLDSLLIQLEKLNKPFRVNMSNNLLDKLSFPQLKIFLRNNINCKEFDISRNGIPELDIPDLIKLKLGQKTGINRINLEATNINSEKEAESIFEFFKNDKKLKVLSLNNCNLQVKKLFAFSKFFGQTCMNNITNLDISNNKVTEGVKLKTILNNLKNNKILSSLKMNNVINIKEEKGTVFNLELFIFSTSLKEFCFDNNKFELKGKTGFELKILVTKEFDKNDFSLKTLSLVNTDVEFVNDCSKIEFDSLLINKNSLTKISPGAVDRLSIQINDKDEKLEKDQVTKTMEIMKRAEEINIISSIEEKVGEYIEDTQLLNMSINNENANSNSNDKSSNNMINSVSNINNENKKEIPLKEINYLLAENIDKEGFVYLKNLINPENSKIKTANYDMTFDKYRLNPYVELTKDEINFLKNSKPFIKKGDISLYGEKMDEESFITKSDYKKFDSFINTKSKELLKYLKYHNNNNLLYKEYISSSTVNDTVNRHKRFMILNYNYFDTEKFSQQNSYYNVEYLELNSILLKAFLPILLLNIHKFTKLKCLVIRDSEINTEEITDLSKILVQLKDTLEEIHLINTFIDAKESKLLLKELYQISNLKLINLSKNNVNSIFIKELSNFVNEKGSVNKIILRNCNLTRENLELLFSSLKSSSLEILDVSGFCLNEEDEKYSEIGKTISTREYYSQYIGYSTNSINKINITGVNVDLVNLTMKSVDIEKNRNMLSDYFQSVNQIRELRVLRCEKESNCFYYLNKFLRNIKVKVLNFSDSLINKKNFSDVLSIIRNQIKLDNEFIKEIILRNVQLDDSSFFNLLTLLVELKSLVKLEKIDVSFNKLNKNSLVYLSEYHTTYPELNFKKLFKIAGAFVTDFENNDNKGLFKTLIDDNKDIFKIKNKHINPYEEEEKLQIIKEPAPLYGNILCDTSSNENKTEEKIFKSKFSLKNNTNGPAILILNETTILSVNNERNIAVWDLSTKTRTHILTGSHTSVINSFEKISENVIASCSYCDGIKLWDLKTYTCIDSLKIILPKDQNDDNSDGFEDEDDDEEEIEGVDKLLLFKENILVSTSACNGNMRVWDISQKKDQLVEGKYSITSLLKLTNKTLAYGDSYGVVRFLNIENLTKTWEQEFNEYKSIDDIQKINEKKIAVCNNNSFIALFWFNDFDNINESDFKLIKNFDNDSFTIRSITIINEDCLLSLDLENKMKLWNLNTFNAKELLMKDYFPDEEKKKDIIFGIHRVNNSKFLFVMNSIHVVEFNYKKEEYGFFEDKKEDSINGITMVNDNVVFTISADGSYYFYDLNTCEQLSSVKAHDQEIKGFVFFNEKKLVTCSEDESIKIWDTSDIKDIKPLTTLKGHVKFVSNVLKYDDNSIVSCSLDKTLKIWDINNYNCIKTIETDKMIKDILRLNKRYLVSAHFEKVVRVWDLEKFDNYVQEVKFGDDVSILRSLDENSLVGSCFTGEIRVMSYSSADNKISLSKAINNIRSERNLSMVVLNNNTIMVGSHEYINFFDIKRKALIKSIKTYNPITSFFMVNDTTLLTSYWGNLKVIQIELIPINKEQNEKINSINLNFNIQEHEKSKANQLKEEFNLFDIDNYKKKQEKETTEVTEVIVNPDDFKEKIELKPQKIYLDSYYNKANDRSDK